MIYGIYFRLNSILQCEIVSVLLTKIFKSLLLLRFLFQKQFLNEREIKLTFDQAEKCIRKAYPDPDRRPVYVAQGDMGEDSLFLLSVVVPVYNYVDVLSDCLDSIINQKTDYSYEVIIVDDGSTDGSASVIEKYKQYEYVRIIRQENQGIGAARNTGLDSATGQYVMFVDCDDCIHEDFIDKMLSRAIETDADIVECAYNLVKKKNRQIYQIIPCVYPSSDLTGYSKECRLLNFEGLPWGKVYKRDLFNGVRYFPGYWNEDTIIQWLVFPQCRRFVYYPKVKYDYSWYENNFSHIQGKQSDIRALEYLWLLKAIVERYDELKLPRNGLFYCLLLTHLSWYLYPKVKGLNKDFTEAVFVFAKVFFEKNRPNIACHLPLILRQVETALLRGDYELWKLASSYH